MKKLTALAAICLLTLAGAATAASLARTVTLKPGHCVTVKGTRVCAARAPIRTVTKTVTPPVCATTVSDASAAMRTYQQIIRLAAQAVQVISAAIPALVSGDTAAIMAAVGQLTPIVPQVQTLMTQVAGQQTQYNTDAAACLAAGG